MAKIKASSVAPSLGASVPPSSSDHVSFSFEYSAPSSPRADIWLVEAEYRL
jgi:hypothetical protein